MKLLLKFKDGMVVQQDITGMKTVLTGDESMIEMLRKAKEQNGPITIEVGDRKIDRTFNDLYSLEILME